MRGDHRERNWRHARIEGPPPRARGPLVEDGAFGVFEGTTPACAGTTTPAPPAAASAWDHPRVRGDHRLPRRGGCRLRGPPPRARGPPPAADLGRVDDGTTPACAGTTSSSQSRPSSSRGPPPRARGPRGPSPRGQDLAGTTPACAGTTAADHGRTPDKRDHPRVRGDHLLRQAPLRLRWGPPPRARGPLPPRPRRCRLRGTTPACAGTTLALRPAIRQRGDHPRVRGDHRSRPGFLWPGGLVFTHFPSKGRMGDNGRWVLVRSHRPNLRRFAALLHPWRGGSVVGRGVAGVEGR